MNFKVVEGHDIPHFEFEQMICKYVRENFLKKHSMLVLCVLSHGDEGKFLITSELYRPTGDVLSPVFSEEGM